MYNKYANILLQYKSIFGNNIRTSRCNSSRGSFIIDHDPLPSENA
jgi:hypothetical protein